MKRILAAMVAIYCSSGSAFGQTDENGGEILPGDEGYPTKQVAPLDIGHEGSDSALFLGGGLGFGQARSTEAGSTAGLLFLGNFELGYQVKRGDWNRVEASLQLFSGKASYRTEQDDYGKADIPINMGLMARLGYGYSIGGKFYGMLKVGVGPVLANFEASPEGVRVKSDETLTGLAAQLGWLAVMPLGSSLDLSGGMTWTHMQFDVDKVKVGGATENFDRSVLINVPQVELGLRLRI